MNAIERMAIAMIDSVIIIGAAAIDMAMLLFILLGFFLIGCLFRWIFGIVWNSAVAAFKRSRR